MEVPTVAACQIDVDDLDVAANVDRVVSTIERTAADDLAVFPEYALTGFVADDRALDVAVDLDGPAIERVHDAVERTGTPSLVGCLARKGTDLVNAAVYLEPNGDRAVYRKRHVWGGERDVVVPGTEQVVVESPLGRTGLLTCYDLNFVGESAAMTDRDVDALLVPGAWPAAHVDNWRLLLRARALDGVRWVVGAGRTGERTVPDAEPARYAGSSLVAAPDGSVRASLDRTPSVLRVECPRAELERHRREIPVLE